MLVYSFLKKVKTTWLRLSLVMASVCLSLGKASAATLTDQPSPFNQLAPGAKVVPNYTTNGQGLGMAIYEVDLIETFSPASTRQ